MTTPMASRQHTCRRQTNFALTPGARPLSLAAHVAFSGVCRCRLKMYVHERMACSYTSMLRYQTCAVLPVMVGEWSLAVDNCMPWLDSK